MAETAAFHDPNKRLLKLSPLPPYKLPAHPLLASKQTQSGQPTLRTFVTELLTEAVAFSDSIVPNQFRMKSSSKSSAPAKADVAVLSCDSLVDGTWFARQSLHEDKAEVGTASWSEFVNGLCMDHSKHEAEYTDGVVDARKVMGWEEEVRHLEEEGAFEESGFEHVGVAVYEMVHKIPFPLDNRVFSVIVVTALTGGAGTGAEEGFVVAQVPVDLRGVPEAIYTNGTNKKEGGNAEQRKTVTIGEYVSIERVKRKATGIWWEMATASDAKGNLPMGMQKMG